MLSGCLFLFSLVEVSCGSFLSQFTRQQVVASITFGGFYDFTFLA